MHRCWRLSTWLTTVFCTATSRSMPHERCPQGLAPPIRCTWHSTLAASWCLCSFLCSLCSGISKFSTGSSSPHLPRPHSWASPSFLVLLHLGCTAVDGRFCSLSFSTYMFAHTQTHILCTCSPVPVAKSSGISELCRFAEGCDFRDTSLRFVFVCLFVLRFLSYCFVLHFCHFHLHQACHR